ncbi:MAG: orotate phosphoribosyltransferase [Syntrophomonadaceae bacterium]|nr:orotate phosphoribosyltransferase [Syntrophomonadaceae bacterium]
MEHERALTIFTQSKALMEGHFKLTSGRHSNQYMQCARVQQYPELNEELARDLAAAFAGDGVEVVMGPAMGGIITAYEVARQLKVTNMFAEREDGKMKLRRGFELTPGTRVLVVEDVITTGGSVKEVIELINELGGVVAGVGILVDRSGGQIDFGVKKAAALTLSIQSWEAADCPLCKAGAAPAIKPGSRG